MTTSVQMPDHLAGDGARHGVRLRTGERVARRLQASLVPAITGVRLTPGDAVARLLNISWSGVLVESELRLKPGTEVNVRFEGTFQPALVPSRVARVNVSGIGPTGALTYHIGLAFATPVLIPDPPTCDTAEAPLAWPAAPTSCAPPQSALRNRW